VDSESKRAFKASQKTTLERFGVAARSRFLDTSAIGGRAHVLTTGHGPPVVMLNGIGTPAVMWAPLMAHLRGCELHAIDLPAHGLTDACPSQPLDLRAHAVEYLEEVMDGLELERPAFVSNSLGSLWALWLAMDHPQRVGAMAHVGCPALAPGTSAPIPMRALSTRLGPLLMRLEPPSPKQVERLSKMVRQYPLPPEVAASILATERMPGFEHTFRSYLRALLRLRGARPEMALTENQLAAVDQPTLLVIGRQDPMGSERAGQRMKAALPHAELRLSEGGHCPWLDDPEQIGDWIRSFLQRSYQRESGDDPATDRAFKPAI